MVLEEHGSLGNFCKQSKDISDEENYHLCQFSESMPREEQKEQLQG